MSAPFSATHPDGYIFPAEDGLAMIEITAEWYEKHKPEAGGYYVIYADGYASYSPAKAFEEGYMRAQNGS